MIGRSYSNIRLSNMVQETKATFKDPPVSPGRSGTKGWTLGAFRTTAAEPLHQLIAILPIHIRLQMFSTTAALTLLSIPHSSQLIQQLRPPWCDADELNDNIPLTPHPAPSTPLTRLAILVPQEAGQPFNYRPGQRKMLPPPPPPKRSTPRDGGKPARRRQDPPSRTDQASKHKPTQQDTNPPLKGSRPFYQVSRAKCKHGRLG